MSEATIAKTDTKPQRHDPSPAQCEPPKHYWATKDGRIVVKHCRCGQRKHGLRLYVSGPMKGYAESNYPAFEAATVALRAAGYEVLSPHEVTLSDATYENYMRADLELLLKCDAVANLGGHEQSKGASLENAVAKMCGLEIKPLAEWLA